MKVLEKTVSSLKRIIIEHPESPLYKPLRMLRAVRRNPIKQFSVRRRQRKLLNKNYPEDARKLILFVTPEVDLVNGGIRSFCSHCDETAKVKHIHGAEVALCTGPDARLLLKYTRFENNNYIYGFSEIIAYFKSLESIMIHLPEYMTDGFLKAISKTDFSRLQQIQHTHINIMLQHIGGLRFMKSIKSYEQLGTVTCTTAHEKYTTLQLRDELGVPLHLLSVSVGPEYYCRKRYDEKEDLMIVSPDQHPMKSQVLSLIGRQFPRLKIRVISNLTYEEYKRLIEQAKWALTFGEGLDGYFVETIFSGGISFSAYNAQFFTEEYRSLNTVYKDYDELIKNICLDIGSLDNKSSYMEYQDMQYLLCAKNYNNGKYVKNLELFYKGAYTFE